MTRQELTAVRDVIDALLRCPDHVRELLTQWIAPQTRWLAPEARSKERIVPLIFSKPNGRDPDPPPPAKARPAKPRAQGQRRLIEANEAQARAAEHKLVAVIRANPDLNAAALARASGSRRSSTGERLKRLSARGAIEQDTEGRWRVAREEDGAGPTEAPPN